MNAEKLDVCRCAGAGAGAGAGACLGGGAGAGAGMSKREGMLVGFAGGLFIVDAVDARGGEAAADEKSPKSAPKLAFRGTGWD